MPEFSAVDTTSKPFVYTHSGGKVLILTFLSSQKKRSQEAVEDILMAMSGIPVERLASLQMAFVMQNIDDSEFIELIHNRMPSEVHILGDEQYHIWGKFGVIATPTVLISDPQGEVLCVKSGHAYDFASVIKSKLYEALEIPYEVSPEDVSAVRTVDNSTMAARAKRHLQMARLLSGRNRIGPAIEQAQMAYEIDPNSPDVALELGELLCRGGKAHEALKLVNSLSGQNNRDKARINLIMGWAKRQLDQLEEAEKHLLEGIRQDSTSPRLYFQLGLIYQKRNDFEKATNTYSKALQLIYPEGQL